ncbi:MAG: acyl carrier protein [Chlorobi bacterium]|nr:acyl carrier protein [Chlorobiota bacterium]
MENKTMQRNLYRVLRKTGVEKRDIALSASFNEDLQFDTIDWKIFTYYLENIFNTNFKDEELKRLKNINDTLVLLKHTA